MMSRRAHKVTDKDERVSKKEKGKRTDTGNGSINDKPVPKPSVIGARKGASSADDLVTPIKSIAEQLPHHAKLRQFILAQSRIESNGVSQTHQLREMAESTHELSEIRTALGDGESADNNDSMKCDQGSVTTDEAASKTENRQIGSRRTSSLDDMDLVKISQRSAEGSFSADNIVPPIRHIAEQLPHRVKKRNAVLAQAQRGENSMELDGRMTRSQDETSGRFQHIHVDPNRYISPYRRCSSTMSDVSFESLHTFQRSSSLDSLLSPTARLNQGERSSYVINIGEETEVPVPQPCPYFFLGSRRKKICVSLTAIAVLIVIVIVVVVAHHHVTKKQRG